MLYQPITEAEDVSEAENIQALIAAANAIERVAFRLSGRFETAAVANLILLSNEVESQASRLSRLIPKCSKAS